MFLVEFTNGKWELTQEKKKIGNYICYKAIKKDTYVGSSGRLLVKQIVAWYTPQIPYSVGPLKYNGLPGLIIELQNDKVVFYAKKISLNTNEKITIKRPNRKEITEKKYYEMLKDVSF